MSALAEWSEPSPFEEIHERIEALGAGGDGTLRGAFLVRALRAVAGLAEGLDDHALQEAVAAPTDFGVLLTALGSDPGLLLQTRDDPLAAARLRGIRARLELLSHEGGSLGVQQVARALGISRQAVDKRRRAGRLLALQSGRHGYAYPAWQLTPDGVLPGLEAVLSALAEHDPWMQLAFFLGENADLDGERPLDALRRGALQPVLRAARRYGAHGAG